MFMLIGTVPGAVGPTCRFTAYADGGKRDNLFLHYRIIAVASRCRRSVQFGGYVN